MSDVDAHAQLILSIVMESFPYYSQIILFPDKHIMKQKSQNALLQRAKLEECIFKIHKLVLKIDFVRFGSIWLWK